MMRTEEICERVVRTLVCCPFIQALFALNRQWLLNEKKAIFRIDTFGKKPVDHSKRVNGLFEVLGTDPLRGIARMKALCRETQSLCEEIENGKEEIKL